jgi:hypothetical protein
MGEAGNMCVHVFLEGMRPLLMYAEYSYYARGDGCRSLEANLSQMSNERKLPKCMDNRRGREHNFGTQRRSCFRVCIALAVVSMGALLSFVMYPPPSPVYRQSAISEMG